MQWPPLVEYLVCLLAALLLPQLLKQSSREAMGTWYKKLHHSKMTPSDGNFFASWMLQYVILGSGLWALLEKRNEMAIAIPVALFLMMIALNSYWLILFFIKR